MNTDGSGTSERLPAGTTLRLTVGEPAHGGSCVARVDGRVVFVRGAIPGETVDAVVEEDRRRFLHAVVDRVVEASPDRVEPCPDVARGGGCCDLSHVHPRRHAAWKHGVVEDLLRRIGRVDVEFEVTRLGPPGETGWRRRTRLAVDAAGRAGYRRARGSEPIHPPACGQVDPAVLAGLDDLGAAPGTELAVALGADGRRTVVEIGRRAVPEHGQGPRRRDLGARARATSRRARAARAGVLRVLEGEGGVVESAGGNSWWVPAEGFWQAHPAAADHYHHLVASRCGLDAGETAWDLYGGVGVLASALAGRAGDTGRVDVLEVSTAAVDEARRVFAETPGIRVHRGAVEKRIDLLRPDPAVVVLDPPRSGAGRAVIGRVLAEEPRRIIHFGCDPASFARDVGLFADGGMVPVEVLVVDAFPGTHHMECIAVLDRARPGLAVHGPGRS